MYININIINLIININIVIHLHMNVLSQSILVSGMPMKKPAGIDYLSEERTAESLKFLDELEDILCYQMAPLAGVGGKGGAGEGGEGMGCGLDDIDGRMVLKSNIATSQDKEERGRGQERRGEGGEEEMTYEEILNFSRFPSNLMVPPNVEYSAVGGVSVGRRNRRPSDLIASRKERERLSRQIEGDCVGVFGETVMNTRHKEETNETSGGGGGGGSATSYFKSVENCVTVVEQGSAGVEQGSAESSQGEMDRGRGRGRGKSKGPVVDVSRIDLIDKAQRSEVRLGSANMAHNVRQDMTVT